MSLSISFALICCIREQVIDRFIEDFIVGVDSGVKYLIHRFLSFLQFLVPLVQLFEHCYRA